MIVSKIVESALKQLGILASGESASGEEIADGIDCLQDLLAQWATSKLYVYKANMLVIPLNGVGEYRVGTRTDDMDCCEYEISICPVCTPVETTEDPCECVCGCTDPVKRPDLIADITMVSDDAWLDNKKFKLAKITNDTPPHCAPVTYWQEPDAWVFRVDESQYKQLKLKVYSLPKTLKAKDELLLPDQYWRALKLSLAVEIAPMFGTDPSLTLLKNQDNALDLLKSSNSVPAFSTNDLRVGVRRYDWHHY